MPPTCTALRGPLHAPRAPSCGGIGVVPGVAGAAGRPSAGGRLRRRVAHPAGATLAALLAVLWNRPRPAAACRCTARLRRPMGARGCGYPLVSGRSRRRGPVELAAKSAGSGGPCVPREFGGLPCQVIDLSAVPVRCDYGDQSSEWILRAMIVLSDMANDPSRGAATWGSQAMLNEFSKHGVASP
jgi:hypothetical protein